MGKRIIAVAVVVASACSALHYSTTSQSTISISNNPYTFNGGGKMTFTLSPKGSGDHDVLDQITLGSNCSSQWQLSTLVDPQQPVMGANVCGFVLGSGSDTKLRTGDAVAQCPANYRFEVSFDGTRNGTDTCNVEIGYVPYRGSGYTLDYLQLIGIGSASGIDATPTQIDFGGQPINTTSASIPITVRNLGSASITVTSSPPGLPFAVTSLGTTTIGPGSAASYNVTCMPTAEGLRTGTVTFTTNVNTAKTDLVCNGINSEAIIEPSPIVFQDTLVGRPPPNRTVTITENGSAGSATIQLVELDAAALAAGVTIVSSPPQGTQIGSGQNVVLAYSAAAVHAAGPLGNLNVKISSDAAPRPVNISGEALVGGVGTNPASIDFGGVCIGSTAMESIEVYANEPGDVVVSRLTKPAAPFDAMVVDTLPKTLAGNHTGPSVMARATMTPTTAGEFKDALALTSDVPGKPTTEVQLSGIGLAEGIAATPNTVSFGSVPLAATSGVKEVQLTNCGSGDLMFDRATITGTHATEFTLIGTNAPRVLKPTESEVFMVVLQPDLPGHKTAQLVIAHSAGTTTAALDGTGDGDGPDDKDRETYYACSTGRGAALWPIALALLALRRRRR